MTGHKSLEFAFLTRPNTVPIGQLILFWTCVESTNIDSAEFAVCEHKLSTLAYYLTA